MFDDFHQNVALLKNQILVPLDLIYLIFLSRIMSVISVKIPVSVY